MTLKKLLMLSIVVSLMSGVAYATDVTFQVMMFFQQDMGNFNPDSGDRVAILGDMNDWAGDANALEMVDGGENGLYAATFDLEPDTAGYEYKFVIIPAEGDDILESFDENRRLVVGNEAIVIDPVWFDNLEPAETLPVTFQVMMSFQADLGNFNPGAGDQVAVHGDMNDWAGDAYALEMVEEGENGLYTATFDIDADTAGYEYKFVIIPAGGDDMLETIDLNRMVVVGDTAIVIAPVWFNNMNPADYTNVEVLFQVDMSVAMDGGLFDPNNDGVIIGGNWDGNSTLQRVGNTDTYGNWVQFENAIIDTAIKYLFAIDPGDDEEDTLIWEELPRGGNRILMPTGEENDQDNNGFGEVIQEVAFWADNPGNISQDVTIHFLLDAHPAFAKFEDVGIEGIEGIYGLWIAGPPGIGWNWGELPVAARMNDNGEAPDENADDMIYGISIMFAEGSPMSQVYKYGINNQDKEAEVGKNHFVLLDDEFATMVVRDIFGTNGDWYDDYMSVRPIDGARLPTRFEVAQNFPNPFNSTTSISFNLDVQAEVTVRVFDLTGAEVMTHRVGELSAGSYRISLNAAKLSSGTYIYQVEAGEQTAAKKMMLLK